MSRELLRSVLDRLEASCDAGFGWDEICRWSPGGREWLEQLGLLVETERAAVVECDGCDEQCICGVDLVVGVRSQAPRAFVVCGLRDDMGRVPVPLDRLRRWRVDAERLCRLVALAAGLSGAVRQLGQHRLWSLGYIELGNRRVDLFLAHGPQWPHGGPSDPAWAPLDECSYPVLLVPVTPPPDHLCPQGARVLSVDRLLRVEPDGLRLDLVEISRMIGAGRARGSQGVVPFRVPKGTQWSQVIIEVANSEVVRISVGAKTDHRTFEEMGCADRRKPSPQPDVQWGLLLQLAEGDGQLAGKYGVAQASQGTAKKMVSKMRRVLRAVFPDIPGDPFHPYTTERGYTARFVIRSERRAAGRG